MSHLSEPDADRQLDEGREPDDEDMRERLEIEAEEEAGMQRAEAAFGNIADDEDVDAYFDRFGV